MGALLRSAARTFGAALACVALLLALAGTTARADGPNCPSSVMYVAAHADDTLLFQSPSLLWDVRGGRCVQTVFLTAGDAGDDAEYWEGREEGALAGYAQMLGVPDEWTASTAVVDGHPIQMRTLDALPKVSIAFMRLPDGGPAGAGTPAYGSESLTKLWRSVKGGSPSVGEIEAVDGSSSYDFGELVEALAAMLDSFGPRQIATQNYLLPLVGPEDHADHVGTGKFTQEATAVYGEANRLRGFLGYNSTDEPANVFDDLLGEKSDAFYAYGEHDAAACADEAHCKDTAYEKWLAREYVFAEETTGAVAQAGYPQAVLANQAVDLNGEESSGESGGPLVYAWAQVGGIPVTLSGAATEGPSFFAPPYRTTLRFSLTVADGAAISEPDYVTVEVDGPEQPPPDPPAPGDPPVAADPPRAVPPIGGPAPRTSKVKLSSRKVLLRTGRVSRHTIKILGTPRPWVECTGTLPKGASCRVTPQRRVVIEGSKRLERTGTYRLTVHVVDGAGTVKRPLIVQVGRP